MSVAEAQRQVSQREFAEWMVYAELEPFGEERADLRMGILASIIANVNRGKNQRPYQAKDFMPKFGEQKPQPRRQQTVEEMQKILANAAGWKI